MTSPSPDPFSLLAIPPFEPAPWCANGHLQTLAGAYWGAAPRLPTESRRHWIVLDDGDWLALHDNSPADWRAGDRCALLVHGLAGCHQSRYLVRMTAKLNARGLRVFRLDLRGCGAGRNRASQPYHAGRWEDIDAAVRKTHAITGAAPLGLCGFSLGGSLVLRWLGETAVTPEARVLRALAVSPPVDLLAASESIARAANGFYDRYFARTLYEQVRGSTQWNSASPLARRGGAPARLLEFDDLYTAPLCGFESAERYYRTQCAALVADRIRTPTLVLAAEDDPLIPVDSLRRLPSSTLLRLHVEPRGGHLGFVAGRTSDADRHWLDWRVVDWLTAP